MVHTGAIYETPKVNPQRGASSAHGIRKFLEKKIVSSAPRQTSILTKYLVEFKIHYNSVIVSAIVSFVFVFGSFQ